MMKKQIILHIGTYKTGTTSIQRFARDHARMLGKHSIALYSGQFSEENHFELYLAALRYERDSFAKLGVCKHLTIDADFTRQVADRVRRFIRRRRERHILLSSEGLSLLRYDDEIERLNTILDADNSDVRVVVYFRNKADFLRSYTNQLLKVDGRRPSTNRESALYVEPDTWLTDYDALLSLYRRWFGDEQVVAFDYDEEMRRDGNVIPSFLRSLGIDAADWPQAADYFLNASSKGQSRSPRRTIRQRMKRVWRKWSNRAAA